MYWLFIYFSKRFFFFFRRFFLKDVNKMNTLTRIFQQDMRELLRNYTLKEDKIDNHQNHS